MNKNQIDKYFFFASVIIFPIMIKEKRELGLKVIGKHYEKYRFLMTIVLSFIFFMEIGMSIYWFFDENNISLSIDLSYVIFQSLLALLALLMIGILYLNKTGKIKTITLAIIFHSFAFLFMMLGTGLCIVDLRIGVSPFVFLIVSAAVASLFMVDPYFFIITTSISVISILISHLVKNNDFFSGSYAVENIFEFIIYVTLMILIAFRHYNVTIREYNALKKVEQLTYYDGLTDLLNERSYISKVDEINKSIRDKDIKPFAVILMDVNNLKATNDAYGHRYGCHLIVKTGHMLPEFFKTSSLFHVGGDEFIVIVEGEDYQNFDKLIEEFDKAFSYSLIEFDGRQLIFSVARGYAKYVEGEKYTDVLQKADKMMYENKEEIKTTYHLKGR